MKKILFLALVVLFASCDKFNERQYRDSLEGRVYQITFENGDIERLTFIDDEYVETYLYIKDYAFNLPYELATVLPYIYSKKKKEGYIGVFQRSETFEISGYYLYHRPNGWTYKLEYKRWK